MLSTEINHHKQPAATFRHVMIDKWWLLEIIVWRDQGNLSD